MVRLRRGVAIALIGCVLGCAWPATVRAHGGAPDIAFWGAFPAATVSCLRRFGRTIQRCVDDALAARRECMDAQLAGQVCDEALRDQRIEAAISAARSAVTKVCTGGQLTELRFINPDDARTDVTKACTDQPEALMSVAYAPFLASGSAAAVDEEMRSCLLETAAHSRKLLRYIVRLETRTLDQIAVNLFGPSGKNALLRRSDLRIAAAREKLARLLLRACPTFEAMYGRSASSVLSALGLVGDCVVGAGYVQTAIACPVPVCGNGVKESGEQCDDGNSVDADRCHDNCTNGP